MASKSVILLFFLFLVAATFQCSSANYSSLQKHTKNTTKPLAPSAPIQSTAVLPASGSLVDGYYYVTNNIGNPPKPYVLDIDTGSDLTWIQCDAPCQQCYQSPHPLYKPSDENIISCADPVCNNVRHPPDYPCRSPNDRCHYLVEYQDGSSSVGFLVRDTFSLSFLSGSTSSPYLVFGCGFKQTLARSGDNPFHYTDGVLGLSPGNELNIVTQLNKQGLTKNVFGHCLRNPRDGYFFLGSDIPRPPMSYAPLDPAQISQQRYSPGVASLGWNGVLYPGFNDLQIILDSGATYSYFKSRAYFLARDILRQTLSRFRAPLTPVGDDQYLPDCWKGPKPIGSVNEVRQFFRDFGLVFPQAGNVLFQLPPEAYLTISPSGNVCLGILNGTEYGLGDLNLIGDISMQNRFVIYDNERNVLGWGDSNCNTPSPVKSDHNRELPQTNPGNFSSSNGA